MENNKYIGKQYPKDNRIDTSGFLSKARLHQSIFRVNELKLTDCDDYGNYLIKEDAEKGANFYNGFDIFEAIKNYRGYNKPLYANMLRSEHIPFNLFVPLIQDKAFCKDIFNDFLDNSIQSIDHIEIEYAPPPASRYLNDKTSFDTYIEYTTTDEEKAILGIEVKYTEGAYLLKKGSSEEKRILDQNSTYYTVSRKSGLYKDNAEVQLITDDYRQVWRNQLLGESILQVDKNEYKKFTSITIFPEANVHFVEISKGYLDLMNEGEKHFISITYEDFIEFAYRYCPNEDYKNWIDYLKRRYIVE